MKVNLDLIKTVRNEKGYSANQMAEMMGLSNGSMYWKRENGVYKFKAEELMTVSKILNVPIDDLFLSNKYSETEIA